MSDTRRAITQAIAGLGAAWQDCIEALEAAPEEEREEARRNMLTAHWDEQLVELLFSDVDDTPEEEPEEPYEPIEE